MTAPRTPMTFLKRDARVTPPTVSPQTNLIPRTVIEASPEIAEAYDRFTNAKAARHSAYAEGRKLRDKAELGRKDYQAKVREAVSTGGDTSKLNDPHDTLITKAEAVEAVARNAEGQLLALGRDLGAAIQTHAPELFAASEAAIEAAASRIRADLETLTRSWAEYAEAWQVRRILSDAHYFGGGLNNYDPNPALPAQVGPALDNLTARLNDLAALRADEAELTTWRAHEVAARNAAGNFG